MANKFNRSEDVNHTPSPAPVDLVDLLEALLEPEDAPYPWNPADPESEAYFAEREQEFVLAVWSEEEMTARSPAFFTELEQLWSATTPTGDRSSE